MRARPGRIYADAGTNERPLSSGVWDTRHQDGMRYVSTSLRQHPCWLPQVWHTPILTVTVEYLAFLIVLRSTMEQVPARRATTGAATE